MKTMALAVLMAVSMAGCNAQEKKDDGSEKDAALNSTPAQPEPRGTWKVTKELDENGNLIRYDSIYQYSYGNINGQEVPPREMDSVMASFQEFMQARMPRHFAPSLMDPLERDSLHQDFFENGFFQNHWEDFFPEMQQQLRQMDSLHRQFFQQARPGLFPPEEKKNRS